MGASGPYFTATEGMGDAIVLRDEIRQTVGFIRGALWNSTSIIRACKIRHTTHCAPRSSMPSSSPARAFRRLVWKRRRESGARPFASPLYACASKSWWKRVPKAAPTSLRSAWNAPRTPVSCARNSREVCSLNAALPPRPSKSIGSSRFLPSPSHSIIVKRVAFSIWTTCSMRHVLRLLVATCCGIG